MSHGLQIEALKRAVRTEPLILSVTSSVAELGLAQLIAGQYEDALETADACSREYLAIRPHSESKWSAARNSAHIGRSARRSKKVDRT